MHEAQLSVQCGRRTSRRGLSAWRGEGGSPALPPPPPAAPLPPPTIGSLSESADAAAMVHCLLPNLLYPCDPTSLLLDQSICAPGYTQSCAFCRKLRYLDIMREVRSTLLFSCDQTFLHKRRRSCGTCRTGSRPIGVILRPVR